MLLYSATTRWDSAGEDWATVLPFSAVSASAPLSSTRVVAGESARELLKDSERLKIELGEGSAELTDAAERRASNIVP